MSAPLRPPLTIQAFAEAFGMQSPGRFPPVAVTPADQQMVVLPSRQLGKTEAARRQANDTPWTGEFMAALQAPRTTRMRTKRPGPDPGEDYAGWYRRIFGEPFSDEMHSFVKSPNVGTTEIAMASTLRSLRSFERYRDLDLWAAGALDGSWLFKTNGDPVAYWDEDWASGDLKAVCVGADYATDRREWDVAGWGRETWEPANPPPPVALKPAPRRNKLDLLATSANIDLNKVKSVRSTKPQKSVIRFVPVANRVSPPSVVRKRSHGPA